MPPRHLLKTKRVPRMLAATPGSGAAGRAGESELVRRVSGTPRISGRPLAGPRLALMGAGHVVLGDALRIPADCAVSAPLQSGIEVGKQCN